MAVRIDKLLISNPEALALKKDLGGVHYICAMQQIIQSIQDLYQQYRGKKAASIDVLPR